jgi:hypothetical protein
MGECSIVVLYHLRGSVWVGMKANLTALKKKVFFFLYGFISVCVSMKLYYKRTVYTHCNFHFISDYAITLQHYMFRPTYWAIIRHVITILETMIHSISKMIKMDNILELKHVKVKLKYSIMYYKSYTMQ